MGISLWYNIIDISLVKFRVCLFICVCGVGIYVYICIYE